MMNTPTFRGKTSSLPLKAIVRCIAVLAFGLVAYSQQSVPAQPLPAPGNAVPPVVRPLNLPSSTMYSGVQPPLPAGAKQPVLILLYSRFYDHTGPQYALQRINTLLPMIRRLRQQFPDAGVSALFQFSGTMSEVLSEMSEHQPELQDVKNAAAAGLIEIGYTGEDEPTYATRPRADFLFADTPEKRWLSRNAAAERFLNDYKDPVTGDAIPGLTGGIKRAQEVFGKITYASGLTENMGDNSPIVHQLRNMHLNPVLAGFPDNDPTLGVLEYRFGVTAFAKLMAPLPTTSPEVFWEDNVLRASEIGGVDIQSLSTDDGPAALQAAFAKMDRSHVRVVHMEIGSYLQYLKKGTDGKVLYPPLAWTYSHPATPEMPSTLKTILEMSLIDAAKKKEQDSLQWLFHEFLPANPGSHFISVAALSGLAPTSLDSDVSQERLRVAATDLARQFARTKPTIPSYARSGDEYFSLVDMFGMLSGALTEFSRSGSLPQAVRLTNVYGPPELSVNMGPDTGEFSVEAICRAAAGLSEALREGTWKTVPVNTVPEWVNVEGVRVNAAQFLSLMAQAFLDPTPLRKIKLERALPISPAAGAYPRRIAIEDMGMGWTLKPAILHLPPVAPGAERPPPPPVPR